MYFHFRSKHALALAVVDGQLSRAGLVVQELVDRKLSGLETLIDFGYQMAVGDITSDATRAMLHLLPVVGRTEGMQTTVLNDVVKTLCVVAERAIAEGDIADTDPEDMTRVLVAVYLGMRQAGDLDEPEQFLRRLERAWAVLLAGVVPAERIDYFLQFIRRRTSLAVKATSGTGTPDAADDRVG